MKKAILRSAVLPALLAGAFILLDLVADRYLGGFGRPGWPHLILAVSVLLISYILISRAMVSRRRAEAVLRQARDEMESRVRERTAELERVNEALRTEVAERKRVEHALRTSEETARALLNASSESAVLLDTQGIVLASNETAAQRLGTTVQRLVGSSLFDSFTPEVAETRRTYLDYTIHSGQPVDFIDERAGRTFDTHVYPVSDTDGHIIRLAVFGQDITERMQAEAVLRQVNQRLELTQAAAGAGSWDWDIPSGRLAWSPKMFDLFGLDMRTTVASLDVWRSVLHPEDREAAERQIDLALQTHSELVNEYRIIRPDGRIRWISALGNGIYDEQDRPSRMSGICLDITKRKRSEESLRQVQAEVTLGIQERIALEERQRLARELHDSVSQTLYGISLGVNTALALFDADRTKVLEALHYSLALAHSGLKEMRALIFELRPESLEMEGLVIALTKHVNALRARHGIEVELSLCDEPDVPLSVKEALYRIAQEALQNAVKHARPDRLEVRLTREPDIISLEVRDNGVGFDAQAAYPGHLGLRSMRERATSAGGTLEIISLPNCGTQIRARVPFIATPATPSA